MQRSAEATAVTEDLPKGWLLLHHIGRAQPWTLLRKLGYSPRDRKGQSIYKN